MTARFETVLPRLVSAYERGRLVPFIGSGMSLPTCATWDGLIGALERSAEIEELSSPNDPHDLIRRANAAVRKLRHRSPERFPEWVRQALDNGRDDPPAQTQALALLPWPLVLTTNYDDCYVAAFEKQRPRVPLDVLGRSPADCQRVLTALTAAADPILWALQGYLGGPCVPNGASGRARLERELVIGHEEYRRVTYREPHFRRAFAEVFHNRSLLFVGSGLADPYLLELFGEILETYGPSARSHYALVKKGVVRDPAFLLSRFQTVVVEYDEHADLPKLLTAIADHVDRNASRETRWSFALASDLAPGEPCASADVEIVRGPLCMPRERECLALSAGGDPSGKDSRFYFSERIQGFLRALGSSPDAAVTTLSARLGRFEGRPYYAVRARADRDWRDVRVIRDACTELFDAAERDGFARVQMQLLAVGEGQVFPARASLIQILRAFATWRRADERRRLALAIHVVDASLLQEIASGRLDPLEQLACADLRFWTDLVQAGGASIERRSFQRDEDTTLAQVCDELDLPDAGWDVEILPPPGSMRGRHRVNELAQATLETLGVVPGSTLRFTASEPPTPRS